MLSIVFQSHLIRHSDTGFTSKDTQRVLEHLRHSESTRALGARSEGTWALRHLESTRRALRHLRHLGTRAFRYLMHIGTRALGHSRHLI